jgi:endonuclease/exonuclease/phosphatase family metal-dependent hydrolase
VELTVMTWNLKGHDGPDTDAVVDHARAAGADLVALQEVQRPQAQDVARGLDAASLRWGFKHWSLPIPPEGLAVIGVTRPVRVRTRALTFRFRPWSWRRRIFQVAAVGLDGSGERRGRGGRREPTMVLANAHLSAYDEDDRREREAATIVRAMSAVPGPTVVVGDLNDDPHAEVIGRFRQAGFRDTWAEANPDHDSAEGATNWHGWQRGTSKRPNRRLDYVLVPPGPEIRQVTVPRHGEHGFDRFTTVSDHLPVVATLAFS